MANNIIPVIKVSGIVALIIFAYVIAMFGTAHLVAISNPDHPLAKAWIALGF